MKKSVILIGYLFWHFISPAQNSPVLTIQNDTAEVKLESLKIEVEIVGNIATTITKMVFFNPNSRVLEGELNFPLMDGQQVFRFAMDINGKLREGVVVEKNQGRKAFEAVVRQAVDPGLLEMTVGNNYKARVYPIPANGRKSIVVGYEEILPTTDFSLFQLVANFGRVKDFNIKVVVVNQDSAPLIKKNELANFKFKKWQQAYLAEHHEQHFNATGVFSFQIPVSHAPTVYTQSAVDQKYFFILHQPDVIKLTREHPESLGIYWDVSLSGRKRDLEKELTLLKKYLLQFPKCKISVFLFSNKIIDQKAFTVREDLDALSQYLMDATYDGGTNLYESSFDKGSFDEMLIFTDGINNLGAFPKTVPSVPVHTVTSSLTNDVSKLKQLSQMSGGQHINLLNSTVDDALSAMQNLNYQFIGAEYDPEEIFDVYPQPGVGVKENKPLTLTGKLRTIDPVEIKLKFGVAGRVLDSIEYVIGQDNQAGFIPRIWAKQKVNHLMINGEEHKEEIIKVAKQFNLVTRFTSLIILENVEDYVRYEIEPPVEFLEEYNILMDEKKLSMSKEQEALLALAQEDYSEIIDWWENDRKDATIETKDHGQAADQTEYDDEEIAEDLFETDAPQTEQVAPLILNSPATDAISNQTNADEWQPTNAARDQIITGEITDDTGETLPGVNILIKGTTFGTTSDRDGRFQISVNGEDILVFSYVGFLVKEGAPGGQTYLKVVMEPDIQQLSEVVVIGYAAVRRSLTVASALVVNLSGQAAGVNIENSDGAFQDINTTGDGRSPLYVIDGKVVTSSEVKNFDLDEIATSQIIKNDEAMALFGSRAANGVVLITTHQARENGNQIADSIASRLSTDTEIQMPEWEPNVAYLDSIKAVPGKKNYETYLRLRNQYGHLPTFYLTMGNYFIQSKMEIIGERILSNIVELELENHELLKLLAHRYMRLGAFETSIFLFQKILEIRNEEPHSKRDLALAYQANGEYQHALDLFLEIINMELDEMEDRFPLFKSTVIEEMNNLIAFHKGELNLSNVPTALIKNMPVDIRVVLEWNTLETDLDLWITEPNGEKCYYKNALTHLGGNLNEDYLDGYGPEVYKLKNAMAGEYTMEVNYYDERSQKISGPITLQITVFTNYGSEKQQSKTMTLQLENEEDEIEVGRFIWKD